MKSVLEKIKILNALADNDDCDGNCDFNRLTERCENCKAKEIINKIGELLHGVGD